MNAMDTTTKSQKKQPTQKLQDLGNANTNTNTKVVQKRKPVFVKVDKLKPGTNGHNLIVKVLKSDTIVPKGRLAAASNLQKTRIAECLVGDETATILFTARNDQGPYLYHNAICRFYQCVIHINIFLNNAFVLAIAWCS